MAALPFPLFLGRAITMIAGASRDRTPDDGARGGGRLVLCASDSSDDERPPSAASPAPEVGSLARIRGNVTH